jgi:membrane protein implicated in regulation of membrane protease activity
MNLSRLLFIIAAVIVGVWIFGLLIEAATWLISGLLYIAAVIVVIGLIYKYIDGRKNSSKK